MFGTPFWIAFAIASLLTLLFGGLVSSLRNTCPAFWPLLLIAIGVGLVSGFALNALVKVPNAESTGNGSSERDVQARLEVAREQLEEETLQNRIDRISKSLNSLKQELAA